jgi:homopolymeric O-antigen transport system ATP-binding protein
MSSEAIRVEHLAKQYRLGAMRGAFTYGSLRETVSDAAAAWWRLLSAGQAATDSSSAGGRRFIWALDDVSFSVPQGEVVGIIGRNGAGKSTLLKILSRITRPTRGVAEFRGRLGSLLEVGTGFHPELTGRDNVYLNGAILGMRRAEIRRKFDDIVDFSGVSAFIDTPVKRYSSGMYVRLAFAVAAHLDPDILVVDEVLAVGDAAFQKQCLGKMQEVGRSGRTVLFVSHNMSAVTRLCDRTLLLAGGVVIEDGPTEQVVARYLTSELGTAARHEWTADDPAMPGNEWVRLRSVRVIDEHGETVESIDVRRRVGIEIRFDVRRREQPIVPGIALVNEQGTPIFSAMDTSPEWRTPCETGCYTSTAWIPGNLLNEGTVIVSVALGTFAGGKTIKQASADEIVMFQVIDPGEGGTARGDYSGTWKAPVRPLLDWGLAISRSATV